MHLMRVKFIKGKYQGQIHEAVGCNARGSPDDPNPDFDKWHDGIWVPALKERFELHGDRCSTQGLNSYLKPEQEWLDLVIAFDKYGKEIFVGDIVYVPMKHEVVKAEVLKLGGIEHHGCGWSERILNLKNLDYDPKEYGSRNKFVCKYPGGCIKA